MARTLIVGGGLAGLSLADGLETRVEDYLLLEARGRFGGRIKTEHFRDAGFDLGPAWFWPGQPRIAALIKRLGLKAFDQHAEGILTFEDENGQVQRGRGYASMQGSWRLEGGLGMLVDALAERIPADRKRLNAQVLALSSNDQGVQAKLADGEIISADKVVLSLPPRVAAMIDFSPKLPDSAMETLKAVPTWMAGQAKAVAVYDTAFWRDSGLSGDAMSRRGPMVEVHDASPAKGGPYALFGFIGVPPDHRRDEQALRQELMSQFVRMFGPKAANPAKLFLTDWAFEPETATRADHAPLYAHPAYAMPKEVIGLWNGALHFGATEVAPQFGGYLEGALEAAENVFNALVVDTQ